MPLPAHATVKHRWRWLPAAHPWRWLPTIVLVGLLGAALALPPSSAGSVAHAQSAAADALVWSIGGPGMDEARQLAVDPAGNVYVAGLFTSTVDADPGPSEVTLTSAGDTDIFLAKYAPDGSVVWAWSIGGPNSEQVNAVAADLQGNVYIAGGVAGQVDFEPGEADASVNVGSERSGFVAKYDGAGALLWVTPLGLAGDDEVLAIALDGAGNLAAAGLAQMTTSPGQPSTVQRGNLFALRLDAAGRLLWSAVLPTASEGMGPVGVALSGEGEIVLAASYTGTVRVALGAGLVDTTSAGGSDILVLKLTPSGDLAWARSIGSPGNETPGTGGLALDPSGNVVLTGTFDGLLDVGGDGLFVLDSQGESDVLVASLGAGGAVRWASSFGGAGRDGGQRVVTDAASYVYVAGWFTGAATTPAGLDGRALTGRGQSGAADGLLAKFTPDGQLAWARAFGGRGEGPGRSSIATAVTMHPRGDVFLAGRFFGTDVDFDPDSGIAILSSMGQSDGFVAALGPGGALVRR